MLNKAVLQLPPPPSVTATAGYAGAAPLIDLTAGAPWFGPVPAFRRAMARLVGEPESRREPTDTYAPHAGVAALREQIAARYLARSDVVLDPEREILVTHATTGSLWTAMASCTSPGDEVLVPDPSYSLYAPIIAALGRRIRRVAVAPSEGFVPDPDDVAVAMRHGGSMLLINSPNNPTGAVYTQALLQDLVEVCADHGAVIVQDEVLDEYVWDGEFATVLASGYEGAVGVNSLSKSLGLTGWRVGWLAGRGPAVEAARRLHPLSTIAVGHAVQVAAAEALADPATPAVVTARVAQLRSQGELLVRRIAASPDWPSVPLPAGGLYLFVDLGGRISTRDLRDRFGVAVLEGAAFGETTPGFIRISFSGEIGPLRAACDRLAGRARAGTA